MDQLPVETRNAIAGYLAARDLVRLGSAARGFRTMSRALCAASARCPGFDGLWPTPTLSAALPSEASARKAAEFCLSSLLLAALRCGSFAVVEPESDEHLVHCLALVPGRMPLCLRMGASVDHALLLQRVVEAQANVVAIEEFGRQPDDSIHMHTLLSHLKSVARISISTLVRGVPAMVSFLPCLRTLEVNIHNAFPIAYLKTLPCIERVIFRNAHYFDVDFVYEGNKSRRWLQQLFDSLDTFPIHLHSIEISGVHAEVANPLHQFLKGVKVGKDWMKQWIWCRSDDAVKLRTSVLFRRVK
ncbi:hypothetical protein BC830DRAFT_1175798 [Chytriomyces sp. MP71]|nr:hypothetical protein BC830DRAFT_1175798 [Chytriomyces sp. MP71]